MADKRAIGVFDSGLGGLTVVKEICRFLPNENIVYLGDTGRVPYGTRSRDTIRKYAVEDENFLLSQDVKLVVAACGTVSSVAADTASLLPVPFFEVVSHSAKAAVNATKNGKIGVLGTAATVGSASHEKFIKKLLPSAAVTASSCSMFVSLVEEGWYADDDPVVLETARRYLSPLIEAGVDTVILGCTHFPVLKGAIKSVLGNAVTLIDAGTATAEAISNYLAENSLANEQQELGMCKFYVTDKPNSFKKTASVLLGERIDDDIIEQVKLSNL